MSENTASSARERVAVIGLGAMGRRMARRLIRDDLELFVWSRAGVPDESPELGRYAVATPRAAAESADVVLVMVTDDEASRSVWTTDTGVLAGLRRGALAVECSTLSPSWVVELASHVEAAGASCLDAPVVGSRPQADAGALTFLVGGAAASVARARAVLLAMGNAIHHLGPVGTGATAKLLVNSFFATQIAALAELLGAAARAGLALDAFSAAMGTLAVVSPAAKGAMDSMLARRFAPQFPLALVAKDLRYALALGGAVGAELPLSGCVAGVVGHALEQRLAAENLTALIKLYDSVG